MPYDVNKILTILEEYDALTREQYARESYHRQANPFDAPAWSRRHNPQNKELYRNAMFERCQQVGMKVHIQFPVSEPRYRFPFYVMSFDVDIMQYINIAEFTTIEQPKTKLNTAHLLVCCHPFAKKRIEEVLREGNVCFSETGGRFKIYFDLKNTHTEDQVLTATVDCCRILRSIIPDAESQYYFDQEMQKLHTAVRLYLYYYKVGINQLLGSIEPPELVITPTDPSEDEVKARQVESSLVAVMHHSNAPDILQQMLQAGMQPDLHIDGGNHRPTFLENVVTEKVTTLREMEKCLQLVDLLLEYRANPLVSSSGRSCIRAALEAYSLSFAKPLQEQYLLAVLTRLAHANPLGEFIFVHQDFLPRRIGQAIEAVNRFYHTRRHITPQLQRADVYGHSIYFTMRPDRDINSSNPKPSVLRVTTRKLKSLNKDEINALFLIFAERFSTLAQQLGVSLIDYFQETLEEALADKSVEPMIDWIEIVGEDRLCAFNMFQVKPMQIQGKASLVHRILLVAARDATEKQRSISFYRGFMSMIEFIRGFILQRKFPRMKVYTVLEALNERTYVQLANLGFQYYPLYACIPTSVLSEIERAIYADYDISYRHGYLQVDDPLAAATVSQNPCFNTAERLDNQRSRIAARNFHRFFPTRNRHATVLTFVNSLENLFMLEASLGLLIAREMLDKLITGLAKMIQLDGSYKRPVI